MSVRDRVLRTVPRAEEMLARAGTNGRNVASCARMLETLLNAHGADALVDGCIERRDFGDLPRFVRVVFLPCCQVLLSRPVVVGSVFG